jgi:hypothetical protein
VNLVNESRKTRAFHNVKFQTRFWVWEKDFIFCGRLSQHTALTDQLRNRLTLSLKEKEFFYYWRKFYS